MFIATPITGSPRSGLQELAESPCPLIIGADYQQLPQAMYIVEYSLRRESAVFIAHRTADRCRVSAAWLVVECCLPKTILFSGFLVLGTGYSMQNLRNCVACSGVQSQKVYCRQSVICFTRTPKNEKDHALPMKFRLQTGQNRIFD